MEGEEAGEASGELEADWERMLASTKMEEWRLGGRPLGRSGEPSATVVGGKICEVVLWGELEGEKRGATEAGIWW